MVSDAVLGGRLTGGEAEQLQMQITSRTTPTDRIRGRDIGTGRVRESGFMAKISGRLG
jgi:hypothetical protein